MTKITNQIKIVEQLVDVVINNLDEQYFSTSVGIARVKGDANVGWTQCYERRCGRIEDKYDRIICREVCKKDEATRALGRIRGLKTYCNKTRNPESCITSLNRAEDAWNNKVTKIDDRIADAKRQKDQARARLTRR